MENNLSQRITIRISYTQAMTLKKLINSIDSSLTQSDMIRILLDIVHSRFQQDDV